MISMGFILIGKKVKAMVLKYLHVRMFIIIRILAMIGIVIIAKVITNINFPRPIIKYLEARVNALEFLRVLLEGYAMESLDPYLWTLIKFAFDFLLNLCCLQTQVCKTQ